MVGHCLCAVASGEGWIPVRVCGVCAQERALRWVVWGLLWARVGSPDSHSGIRRGRRRSAAWGGSSRRRGRRIRTDAALFLQLLAGAYSAVLRSADGTEGVALVEVYRVK